jgi:lysophospholipase L1-like esterase
MDIYVPRRSAIALAAAGAIASTGTAYLGVRNLLAGQADQARQIISKARDIPPRADGVYTRGTVSPQRWQHGMPVGLHLMIFGDSTATGYGCRSGDEVPGALIARALAERTGKRVRLSTKAIVGATSKGLSGQVDAMLVAGPPPDAAVILIGANDITGLNGIGASARRLGGAVQRLHASGAVVVVGTCPDFGVVTAIPQPLRWVAHARGRRLAHAQAVAVKAAGGIPVPFADLLAPEFQQAPELLFSEDQYHPSAAGYALAANQLVPELCSALGEHERESDDSAAQLPCTPTAANTVGHRTRLLAMSRRRRRPTTGVPAPVVPTAG